MTPQEKRKRTIIERYGSFSKMLAKRDVGDLILGGYNGGKKKGRKGTATWEPGKLKALVASRQRDSQGRFLPKAKADPNDGEGNVHRTKRTKPRDV